MLFKFKQNSYQVDIASNVVIQMYEIWLGYVDFQYIRA